MSLSDQPQASAHVQPVGLRTSPDRVRYLNGTTSGKLHKLQHRTVYIDALANGDTVQQPK